MKIIFFLFSFLLATTITIAQEKVTFIAEISNRNNDTLKILKYKGDHQLNVIRSIISSNGTFKDTLTVEKGFYVIYDGVEMTNIFLKKGFDLKLKMNARDFQQNVFTGNGSYENNAIQQILLSEINCFEDKNLGLNKSDFLENKRRKSNSFR